MAVATYIMSTMKRARRRTWKTLLTFPGTILFGLALMSLGILLLNLYETSHYIWQKLAGIFFGELGFAFIIAVMIFALLEEWGARQHTKSALGYLYGVQPSGTFFDKLEEHVLKKKFYRDLTEVEYQFVDIDQENLLLRYSVQYTVKNVSWREDNNDFVLAGSLNKKPLQAGPTKWDSQLGIESIEIDGEPVPPTDLEIFTDESKQTLSYQASPRRLSRGESVTIRATHLMVKHDHDSGVWHSSIPCTGVVLRLKWRPELDLQIAAEAIHPEPESMIEEWGTNELKITLDQPFLANHGIHFWWSRKKQANEGESVDV